MSCKMYLDSEVPIFSGSSIEGRIVCVFPKPTDIDDITVNLLGDEKTQCVGDHRLVIPRYLGSNSIINFNCSVLDESAKNMTLPPGTYVYQFRLDLPGNLPSTYSNCYGNIRYRIKGKVHLKNTSTLKDKIEVAITSLVNLNHFVFALHAPAYFTDDRTVRICFLSISGRIIFDISVNKRTFVIGETILLGIILINLSGIRVKKVKAKLFQSVTSYFNEPSPYKQVQYLNVATTTGRGAKPHTTNEYSINLDIPSDLYVPSLTYSNLFRIHYILQVAAPLSSCNPPMGVTCQIYLGHIPVLPHIVPESPRDEPQGFKVEESRTPCTSGVSLIYPHSVRYSQLAELHAVQNE